MRSSLTPSPYFLRLRLQSWDFQYSCRLSFPCHEDHSFLLLIIIEGVFLGVFLITKYLVGLSSLFQGLLLSILSKEDVRRISRVNQTSCALLDELTSFVNAFRSICCSPKLVLQISSNASISSWYISRYAAYEPWNCRELCISTWPTSLFSSRVIWLPHHTIALKNIIILPSNSFVIFSVLHSHQKVLFVFQSPFSSLTDSCSLSATGAPRAFRMRT